MRPIVVGCNHKTAPLELRERLTFEDTEARSVMDELRRRFEGAEVVVLSTCNRSEIYVARPTHARPRREDLVRFMAERTGMTPAEIEPHLYIHDRRQAVAHLFRVASSLDSMVVGETQIVGQVKHALARAQEHGAAGKGLTTVFQWALHVAKEVHTETQISEGQVSVGSVAVRFAQQIFASFADKTVVLIGAGEMGKLTLRHVLETQPAQTIVVNRTRSRAESVAQLYGAEALGFDGLEEALAAADLVIASTGSTEPVLRSEAVSRVQNRRGYRPLLLIDIAVPRDIDPAVGDFDNVYLYNIDDVQSVINASVEDRRQEAVDVDRIISEHVDEYIAWRDSRAVGPVLSAYRRRLQEILDAEAAWARPKLSGDTQRDRQILDQMLHRIVGKLLHGPSRTIREQAADGTAGVYVDVLRRMFELPDVDLPDDKTPPEHDD